MVSKVFVYLTHLILPQISQTYLKIFVWLQHLIQSPFQDEFDSAADIFLGLDQITFADSDPGHNN